MIADISMALIVALLFEMLHLTNTFLDKVVTIVFCTTLITTYFGNGCYIDFIGEMDLSVWLLFVMLFHAIFVLLKNGIEYILKHIKE